MIRAASAALLLLAAAQPALAADPRLVELEYDPAAVVRVEGKAKVQATIRFGDDEVIENVAIGDSQSWQVTPNKRANLLFIKPLTPAAATNMTVVTSRRTYFFDLVAGPRTTPLYVLSFTYPEQVEEEREALAENASEVEMAAASDPYAVIDPSALNFAWKGAGDANLLPQRTFDNGEAVFLSWSEGDPVPAILIVDEQGTEGPVNFTVRGDTIVVDGVPAQIVLRSGKDSATLTNLSPVNSRRPGGGGMNEQTKGAR